MSSSTAVTETTSIASTMSMPPVNVSKAGVTMSCANSRCTFTLTAPILSKQFIDKETRIIKTETDALNSWTTNITKFEKNNDLLEDRQKTDKLLQDIKNTKALLAQLKQAANKMGLDRQAVDDSFYTVKQVVEIFRGELSSCYYKSCLRPPPPPTTTTTTTTPTTTPDPCQTEDCTNYGKCAVKNGQPVCSCTGNLGSGRNCQTSTCAYPGTAQPLNTDNKAILVSPGYFWDSKLPQPQYYNATRCQWIIIVQPGETLEVDVDDSAPVAFNVSNMGHANMLWEGDPGSQYKIVKTTKAKYLNSAMSLTTGTKHTFTLDGTASNGAPFSFGFTLKVVPPSAAIQEEDTRKTFTLNATGLQGQAFSYGYTWKKKVSDPAPPKEELNVAYSILKWLGF